MKAHPESPLRIACIGCGNRTQIYTHLASQQPEHFELVAAADPNPARTALIQSFSNSPDFQQFKSDKELLAQPRLADLLVVGTQDSYHFEPALAGLYKGYDLLLEKPISPKPEEIRILQEEAKRLGRKIMVCHVLRYTPFYETVKEMVASGKLGKVTAIHMTEGVGTWHYLHSYVRGPWRNRDTSSPMILAKSCHDMDILSWLADKPCISVASFGGQHEFTSKPEAEGQRCTEDCTCRPEHNALNYLEEQRMWLGQIMDGADEASDEEIKSWLETSPWGRCVHGCDNNVVDRQVAAFEFEEGITATFTMSAFDEGRNLEIFGTEGTLRGGDFLKRTFGCDLVYEPHYKGEPEQITIKGYEGQHGGHMGGDEGLTDMLYNEMTAVPPEEMRSGIDQSIESHFMAFAVDRARIEGRVVKLKELYHETASATA